MNKTTVTVQGKSCLFFHRWYTVSTNGHTQKQKCKDCSGRRILQPDGGYQPLDTDWLFAARKQKGK